MKKLVLSALAAAVLSTSFASHAAGGSTEFSVQSASVVGVTAFSMTLVLSTPLLIVASVSDAVGKESQAQRVVARDDKGRETTLEVPRTVVVRANLQPGDELTVQRRNSGAMLAKKGQPVAYLVPQENATLTKNAELQR